MTTSSALIASPLYESTRERMAFVRSFAGIATEAMINGALADISAEYLASIMGENA